jgi:hypothetical protein
MKSGAASLRRREIIVNVPENLDTRSPPVGLYTRITKFASVAKVARLGGLFAESGTFST